MTLVPFDYQWRYYQERSFPGESWTTAAFDDSEWETGAGVFANVPDRTPVPAYTILSVADEQGDITRHYFRAHVYAPVEVVATLLFTNLVDDGLILYLNGVEIHRVRVGPGDVNNPLPVTDSPTDGASGEMLYLTNRILRAGDNILGAVVCQRPAGSTDVVFGAEIHAILDRNNQNVPLTIVQQPQAQDLPLGALAALRLQVFGPPPFFFQWFKDGAAVPGATNRNLVLETAIATTNNYYAVVTAPGTNVQSDVVAVAVSDTLIPVTTLLRGPYLQTGTSSNILVRWRTNVPSRSEVRYRDQCILVGSRGYRWSVRNRSRSAVACPGA